MSALDKVLAQAGRLSLSQRGPAASEGSPESELVLTALAELESILALADKDDDGDDDDSKSGDTDGDAGHTGHALFKKLKGKGMPDKMAAAMCQKHDDALKATASLTRARNCLLGIGLERGGSWVELTAVSPDYLSLADSGSAKKPYGDVEYADPGYQSDGKKRYPIDAEHVQAAWSYINQSDNAGKYTPEQVKAMKAKIKAAMKRHGHDVSDDDGDADDKKVAATGIQAGDYLLALAGKGAVTDMSFSTMLHPDEAMHHGPYHGNHTHFHPVEGAHEHPHFHNGDSRHELHPHGGY